MVLLMNKKHMDYSVRDLRVSIVNENKELK
jgi:hypothetical protein